MTRGCSPPVPQSRRRLDTIIEILHHRDPSAQTREHHRPGPGHLTGPGPVPAGLHRHRAGRKYMGDVRYLPLAGGEFLYLATVLDCFSRKVVGWSIADHMRTELVANALRMAASTRGGLDGAVFHSDHGAQYGSQAFTGLCDQLGVTRSMGAVGTSADNAACESFHASLKRETLRGADDYGDASACRRTVFAWLTRYNTRRRYSANGHLSPNEYERRHHTTKLTLAA
ncbi:IS3 family transposase [Streptomyces sp. NPDC056468]|uniref:IS3 family transposase n=1 Tax=Streptomyces sp. NPDC056468 TaxID=3345830 RepID=UPI0036C10453